MKTLNIGGEDRPISFNFNCLEQFEEMTGVDPLNGLKLNARYTKVLIYCALKYGAHPEGCADEEVGFDLKKIGSWLDSETLVRAMQIYAGQSGVAAPEKKSVERDPQVDSSCINSRKNRDSMEIGMSTLEERPTK